MDSRQVAAAEAEAIIESQRAKISCTGWKRASVVPTIRALRDHAERCAATNWSTPSACWRAAKTRSRCWKPMSRALTNKFLHDPSHALNHASGDERAQLEALLRRLYHIHHE